MKKTYSKPSVKKVDFVYDEQVVAGSDYGPMGRPTHPSACQYTSPVDCVQIHSGSYGCLINPMSL